MAQPAILALLIVVIGVGVYAQLGEDAGHAFVLVMGFVIIYFAPSIVAYERGHHQRHAILALNLFLGWTVLGWIAAFVWASMAVSGEGKPT